MGFKAVEVATGVPTTPRRNTDTCQVLALSSSVHEVSRGDSRVAGAATVGPSSARMAHGGCSARRATGAAGAATSHLGGHRHALQALVVEHVGVVRVRAPSVALGLAPVKSACDKDVNLIASLNVLNVRMNDHTVQCSTGKNQNRVSQVAPGNQDNEQAS